LASMLNAGLLFRGLRRRGVYHPAAGWGAFGARLFAALAVLTAVLWFGMGSEASWLEQGSTTRVLRLSAIVAAGIGAYFAMLYATGFRLKDFRRRAA
jgi:putative peptidoglycan lipid II flippase